MHARLAAFRQLKGNFQLITATHTLFLGAALAVSEHLSRQIRAPRTLRMHMYARNLTQERVQRACNTSERTHRRLVCVCLMHEPNLNLNCERDAPREAHTAA